MRSSLLIVALLLPCAGRATDVWVFTGIARGGASVCTAMPIWQTDTVLHNLTENEAEVRVLHRSNGLNSISSGTAIGIPAGESVDLSNVANLFNSGLSVMQLDVPDGVQVESRLEYLFDNPCILSPKLGFPEGKISMPTFHLTPGGETQRHFGLDLGTQNARINVGIYNAGDRIANAKITIHRPGCRAMETTEVDIGPDTLQQITVGSIQKCVAIPSTRVPPWVAFATVVVDAPSFSYAAVNSNDQAPSASIAIGTPR